MPPSALPSIYLSSRSAKFNVIVNFRLLVFVSGHRREERLRALEQIKIKCEEIAIHCHSLSIVVMI